MGCLSPLTAVTLLQLRDLGELELDGRLPPEDVDQDLELELVLVDLGNRTGEVGEGPFPHSDALAFLVLQPGPGLLGCPLAGFGLDLQDALHLFAGERSGSGAEADEAGDAGRVAHDVP